MLGKHSVPPRACSLLKMADKPLNRYKMQLGAVKGSDSQRPSKVVIEEGGPILDHGVAKEP